MRGELHTGVVNQTAARPDLQMSGGTRILAATACGSTKDLDAIHLHAAATVHGTRAVRIARGSAHRDGNRAALHLNGAQECHVLADAQSTVEQRAIRHGDGVGGVLFQSSVTLVEGVEY